MCAAVLSAAMLMTGCGGASSSQVASSGSQQAQKEIVEINVMVYDRGHEYQNGNSLTDNEFTRWINEQLEPQGVHVNYVPVPRSGADDKINLMLAGGTDVYKRQI